MQTAVEELLVDIIDRVAARFDKRAILRGGMVLRIWGCERFTNDVDYVFVPYKSKNDFVDELVETIEGIENADVSWSMNSKCLRIILRKEGVVAQVEAKAAQAVATTILPTTKLSEQYGKPPRMIAVMDFPEALANKMAAWNERRLVRDVYDICFYLQNGVLPNDETLLKRLQKPYYSRLVKKSDYYRGEGLGAFYDLLQEHVKALTQDQIEEALADYLLPEEMLGLAERFNLQIAKLI